MENEPTNETQELSTPAPTPAALTSKVTVTATEDCNVLIDGVSTPLATGDTAEMTKDEADAYANLGLVTVGAGGKMDSAASPQVGDSSPFSTAPAIPKRR
jgi:hypothetical protein